LLDWCTFDAATICFVVYVTFMICVDFIPQR
jgi:hypothetical protein